MLQTRQSRQWASLRCLVTAAGVLLPAVGCSQQASKNATEPEMTAPKEPPARAADPIDDNAVSMSDNALLADMSMSPVHFVPNQGELTASGVKRLRRYAEILRVYGGTLHYDGSDGDAAMKEQRIERIKSFLLACGLREHQFAVAEGLAGSQGMHATEAMDVRKASSFSPEQKSSGSGSEQSGSGSGSGGGSGGSGSQSR